VLLNWIRCAVADRPAFGRGQLGWAGLRGVPGFLGQWGGWSGDAHVVALWSSSDSHADFLAGPHDALAAGQVGTYSSADVRLFSASPIGGSFGGGGVPRLAHCFVHADRVAHFRRVHREVWNPGMAGAPGFVGGVFGARDREFLVVTQWESAAAHARYQGEAFPAPHAAAAPAGDLESITGHVVGLEPDWEVLPSGGQQG
jgi:hypothetical protein